MSSPKSKSLLAAALALVTLAAAPSADQKKISIYSSVAAYSLPVLDRNGQEYVGLLEILEPLGRVSATSEGRRWNLRYNNLNCDFTAGKARAKIGGREFDLSAPLLIENSRGLVPLRSLSTLLPRFLGSSVSFHEAARRLFIGEVATQFSTQLDPSNPPRLVLNFTAPVNPTIATEPGKLRMVFVREPVIGPANQSLAFDSPVIAQATFSETNGTAELDITATNPLMATFSNNGKTITVSAAGGTPAAASPPEQAPGPSGQPSLPPAGTAAAPAPANRVLVAVDPAHGGAERGAALTDTLAEKTVTLGFARLLRAELQRHGFAVLLLRENDETLTFDQRAGVLNAAHAAVCISLHAGSQGSGIRVYTAILPAANPASGPFRDWNTAQAGTLQASQGISAAILGSLQKHDLPSHGYSASLRPLNNVLMPAVAIELTPGAGGISDLPSANYQQKAAAAIADGMASARDRLGTQP